MVFLILSIFPDYLLTPQNNKDEWRFLLTN